MASVQVHVVLMEIALMGSAIAFWDFMVMTAASVHAQAIAVDMAHAYQMESVSVKTDELALTALQPFVMSNAVCMVGFVTMVCASFGAQIMQATHARIVLC